MLGRVAELRYFLRFLRSVKWLVVVIILSSIAANLLQLPVTFIPQELTRAFDDRTYLAQYIALATGAMILAGLLSLFQGYCSNRMGEHMARAMRLAIFAKLERLSMLSVMSRGAGQFVQRTVRDVEQIRDLFRMTLTALITQLIQVVVFVVAMVVMEPMLTLVLLVIFALVGPFIKRINLTVERLAGDIQALGERSIDQMVEAVSGFRDIQVSGRFDKFYNRYEDVVRETEQTCVRAGLWAHVAGSLPTVLASILVVVPYFYALNTLESVAGIGRFITYVALLAQAMPLFTQMTRATSLVARATPALRQVRMILDPPPDPRRPVAAAVPQREVDLPVRSIRFEDVGIELGGRWVLRNMSFEIPGGQFTAIVGQSGSGKTTLFMLLARLLEPTEGTIWINDCPLNAIPLEQLRRLLGYIPQNPFIFNQTLRENLLIAVADGEAGDESLAEAVHTSHLSEVIEGRATQGGLDASAGHMGSRLSGGEKQRIALGRLLIQDPQIIVCDEYTANIDVKTARVIDETIQDQFADRIRILITHELYTIRDADHIIVIDDGRAVQAGRHEELAGQEGLYRELWDVQAMPS